MRPARPGDGFIKGDKTNRITNKVIVADVQVVRGLSHAAVNDALGQAGDTVITPPLMNLFRGCTTPRTA